MVDGVGMVEVVGVGVEEFCVGDVVVLIFFLQWFDGFVCIDNFFIMLGDGIDGYVCEVVV